MQEYFERVVTGCLSSVPRLLLTQPLETTLARVQANPNHSVSYVMRNVFDNRGLRGFYDGSTPTFSRYLAMKFFGVPVMTYSYEWARAMSDGGAYHYFAPPVITSLAMAAHDWLAISYLNYKFFQITLNSQITQKTVYETFLDVYSSSRAIPVLQAYRWGAFLGTRELWRNADLAENYGYFNVLGSACVSAAAHALGVPFLERLNNAVNKDYSNRNKAIFQIAKTLYESEGLLNIYKRAAPFVFVNSTVTLLIWDLILSSSVNSKNKEAAQITQ